MAAVAAEIAAVDRAVKAAVVVGEVEIEDLAVMVVRVTGVDPVVDLVADRAAVQVAAQAVAAGDRAPEIEAPGPQAVDMETGDRVRIPAAGAMEIVGQAAVAAVDSVGIADRAGMDRHGAATTSSFAQRGVFCQSKIRS